MDNAARLLSTTLGTFGFPVSELTPEMVADRRRMLEMGVPPVQIHVTSAISGVEWAEAWTDRVEGPLGRRSVHFLGRETFLRNKRRRSSERPRRYRRTRAGS